MRSARPVGVQPTTHTKIVALGLSRQGARVGALGRNFHDDDRSLARNGLDLKLPTDALDTFVHADNAKMALPDDAMKVLVLDADAVVLHSRNQMAPIE